VIEVYEQYLNNSVFKYFKILCADSGEASFECRHGQPLLSANVSRF